LFRPNWVTTERCTAAGCAPCSSAGDGCLVGHRDHHGRHREEYKLSVPADSDLTYSVMTITLKCHKGDKIGLYVMFVDVQNGKGLLEFNGEQLKETKVTKHGWTLFDFRGDKAVNRLDWSQGLRPRQSKPALVAAQEENEFRLLFKRANLTAAAEFVVSILIVDTRPKFTECEDTKVCLGKRGLGEDWSSQPAKNLRQSIKLQWDCLKGKGMPENHGAVCKRWSNCLKNATDDNGPRFAQIINILDARGADKAPSLPQFGNKTLIQTEVDVYNDRKAYDSEVLLAKKHTLSEPFCRDPHMSDPESWDCACHEQMAKRCPTEDARAFDSSCYRALLCRSPKVCDSWKRAICCTDNDAAVKTQSKGKALSCRAMAGHCQSATMGRMVQWHCPKTCGMCMLGSNHELEATVAGLQQMDIELGDSVTGKAAARHAWAPTSPTVNPTEPPNADEGPTNAGEVCAF